jgi:hypothetical protein
MKKHWLYLKYVVRHKWHVFWACFWIANSLSDEGNWRMCFALLWRGIKHDWTKFLPSEWSPYAEYFYGAKRPDIGTKGYNHALHQDDGAFNVAWNYHQKRNDHHWQYWVIMYDDGKVFPLPMPEICRWEMIADWRGAGKAQGKPKTWEWYEVNKDKQTMETSTREWCDKEKERQKDIHRVGVMLGFEAP